MILVISNKNTFLHFTFLQDNLFYGNNRIEGKVQLSLGQSMFFQVKSNDGSQIAIRPFSVEGTGANYTLLQALSAAVSFCSF